MSIQAIRWAWSVISGSDLSGCARLVLLKLADAADVVGANAYPGVERTLGPAVGRSARQVKRALVALRRRGLIEIQAPPRHHRPTTYCLPGVAGVTSVSPLPGVTPMSPHEGQGCHHEPAGVTPQAARGDIAGSAHLCTDPIRSGRDPGRPAGAPAPPEDSESPEPGALEAAKAAGRRELRGYQARLAPGAFEELVGRWAIHELQQRRRPRPTQAQLRRQDEKARLAAWARGTS